MLKSGLTVLLYLLHSNSQYTGLALWNSSESVLYITFMIWLFLVLVSPLVLQQGYRSAPVVVWRCFYHSHSLRPGPGSDQAPLTRSTPGEPSRSDGSGTQSGSLGTQCPRQSPSGKDNIVPDKTQCYIIVPDKTQCYIIVPDKAQCYIIVFMFILE